MIENVVTLTEEQTAQRDAFVERLLQSTAGLFDIYTIYIGHRLGYYKTLAGGEPVTSVDLAHRTGTQERYAREWLKQQVADFGCGAGWSSIGIAQAYPKVQVDGFDLDEPSIQLAWANLGQANLNGRVKFHVRDAGDPTLRGQYDLVTAFECVHDMSDPVNALRTMRRLVNGTGSVMVVDERVGDSFTPGGNEVEWMMYGWSVLHCLPVGMADGPAAGTGTVMRTDTLRHYAREAGFREVEVLPIDNFFFRFYRLVA